MSNLLEKFNDYRSIINYRIRYEFEDDSAIEFKLKQSDFPHLLGLNKLIDIPIIRQFNDIKNQTVSAKFLISKIKKEELLTESTVKSSLYFPKIQDRYENFCKENLLSITYTDAIIDFNPALLGSDLKARYILFEEKGIGTYNHLCIAQTLSHENYIESFFYEPSNRYLKGQKIIKVKKVIIYDDKGKVFLEDTLIE